MSTFHEPPIFCGVDVGTSSIKIGLFSETGQLLFRADSNSIMRSDLTADQSTFYPRTFWSVLLDTWREIPVSLKPALRAICFVGQGPTIVPMVVGDHGSEQELPVISWRQPAPPVYLSQALSKGFDAQMAPVMAKLMELHDRIAPGCENPVYLLQPMDYLSFRCSGKLVNSSFDARGFYPWDRAALKQMGLQGCLVAPDLYPAGKVIGQIDEKAASLMSLSRDVIVVSGCPDFAAALLGTATLEDGILCDRGGSSQGVTLCSKQRIQASGVMTTPFFIPDHWKISGVMNTTGSALQWFCAQIAHIPLEGLDEGLIHIPRPVPVLFHPYLSGERSPFWNPKASGSFMGLRLDDTSESMALAIMESVGYQIRQILDLMEEAGGQIRQLRSTGGQSRSPLWNQIKADIIGREIVVGDVADSELLGAAILSMGGLLGKDVIALSKDLYRPAHTFFPDERRSALYNPLFQAFTDTYDQIRRSFDHLYDARYNPHK